MVGANDILSNHWVIVKAFGDQEILTLNRL
jgi:hypothetical protein